MTAITEPCWVADMPEVEYHADPCPERSLSSTMAKAIIDGEAGPARLREVMLTGWEPKPEFEFGSAAHESILNRGEGVQYLDASDWRTKAARDWREEIREAGGIPLLAKQKPEVEAMAEQILANPVAAELFTRGTGQPEMSMFTIDRETGRWRRGRIDFLVDRSMIVDFKTSGQQHGAELEVWVKASYNFGYHQQAEAYLSQAVELGLVDPDAEFVHVVQEVKPPYPVGVYRVTVEQLLLGRALNARAMRLWDRCLTLDDWPGIPMTIRDSYLPAYAHQLDEEEDY